MTSQTPEPGQLFIIRSEDGTPLIDAIERALADPTPPPATLPVLTNVALGDPYLAEQLTNLHRAHEIVPAPAKGLLARLRTRLGWWLLGREIHQINEVHAALTRVLDSLIVQLDHDRAARRRLEEQVAYDREQR